MGEPNNALAVYMNRPDRIRSVLNLTLYWGTKKWEKPLCLQHMMEELSPLPEKLRNLVGNYEVHLVCMRFIPEEKLQEMDSDLKYVLGLMKHTRSRKKYEDYILENREFFQRVPRSAVDVIDACTNIKDIRDTLDFVLNPETGEEEADVCKALTDIKKHAERQGRKQGIEQGIEQGTQRINKLNQLLIENGRQGDLLRSIVDPLFQKKLFMEYKI